MFPPGAPSFSRFSREGGDFDFGTQHTSGASSVLCKTGPVELASPAPRRIMLPAFRQSTDAPTLPRTLPEDDNRHHNLYPLLFAVHRSHRHRRTQPNTPAP